MHRRTSLGPLSQNDLDLVEWLCDHSDVDSPRDATRPRHFPSTLDQTDGNRDGPCNVEYQHNSYFGHYNLRSNVTSSGKSM